MSGKTNTFSEDVLKLIFNGTPIANIADNASVSPLTTLYLSLHTADPTDDPANQQHTNAATYTGYARVPVVRTAAGWEVVGKTVSPADDVAFPTASAGIMTATHAGIGTAETGSGKLLYSGALSPAIAISPGVRPIIEAGSTITEE